MQLNLRRFSFDPETPPVREPVAVPLRPVAPVEMPRAIAVAQTGCLRRFANDGMSSRLPAELPSGAFRLAWQVDLDERFPATSVLCHGNRILTHGALRWDLRDSRGRPIKDGPAGAGDVRLAPEHACFYTVDRSGFLCAFGERGEGLDFQSPLLFADKYMRHFIAVHRRRVTIAGVEVPQSAHEDPDTAPRESIVESFEIPEPPPVDETGLLESTTAAANLIMDTLRLLPASADGWLALAAPDTLLLLDPMLEVRIAVASAFEPIAMSMDERRGLYLAVRAGERDQLWRLGERGELYFAFGIPRGVGEILCPPVVGFDHTAHLVSEQMIVAVDQLGNLRWARPAQARFLGAFTTANDRLLVTDGNEIAAYDERGQRHTLYDLPGESFTSPAVLNEHGEILVLCGNRLLCLTRARGS